MRACCSSMSPMRSAACSRNRRSSRRDSPEVSSTLVDYVMYHELLHKKHGAILVNGRRVAHSPAFRDDERRFIGWKQAEDELTRLAHRQAKGWR